MDQPRLLVRSQREHIWRIALLLVPVALSSIALGLIGAWLQAGVLVAVSTLGLVVRIVDWSRCGDLWDTGESLQVRQGMKIVGSVRWSDVKHVYFWYHERIPPEWHGIFSRQPALPRVVVSRDAERTGDMAHDLPAFCDLYLHSRGARRAAEDALARACQQHGVLLRGRHTRPPRSIDWSTASGDSTGRS